MSTLVVVVGKGDGIDVMYVLNIVSTDVVVKDLVTGYGIEVVYVFLKTSVEVVVLVNESDLVRVK